MRHRLNLEGHSGTLALILPERALSMGLTELTHRIRITLAAVLKNPISGKEERRQEMAEL